MALKTQSNGRSLLSLVESKTPVEQEKKMAEDTIAYKLGTGIARTFREPAKVATTVAGLAESAFDTFTGILSGKNKEQIMANVQDAMTRPRNWSILGGSNVRPIGFNDDGTPKQQSTFEAIKESAFRGVDIGTTFAPGISAAKGASLSKIVPLSAGIEATSGAIGETARQLNRGEIKPGDIASTAVTSGVIGAALPIFGKALGSIIPTKEARALQAASAAENARILEEGIANDATKKALIWKLTDKTPDDLKKFTSRVVKKNEELTKIANEIADEEAILKSMRDMDLEANIKPQLEEIRRIRTEQVVPIKERLTKVIQENSPTKARENVSGAIASIDRHLGTLKKSTSEYKRLSSIRSLLSSEATYLLRESKDLQRLGFKDLADYGDDIVRALKSIPESKGAAVAAKKLERAVNSSKKAFQAIEDLKTKPDAFVKAAQDKLIANSQSKLSKQIADKESSLLKKKELRESLIAKLAEEEATPEAQYVRELVKEFGSLDSVQEQFKFFKGVNKDVEPFTYRKEFMDELGAGLQPVTGIKNLFGVGADAIRQIEALAKDNKTLQLLRQHMIQPLFSASRNFTERVASGAKRTNQIIKEAGIDLGSAPLLGARRFLGVGSIPDIMSKRQMIYEAIENDTVDSLPPTLQKAAQFFKDEFNELIQRANANRRLAGLPEINYTKNYVTRLRAETMLRQFGLKAEEITDDVLDRQLQKLEAVNNKERVTFAFEKQRTGGLDYEKDPVDALTQYRQYIERDMEMNLLAMRIRPFIKLIDEKVGGKTAEWFRRWTNEGILGQASEIDRRVDALSKTVDISKFAGKMSANFSKAALLGNIGTALAQLTTIPLIAAKNGRGMDTLIALGHALRPRSIESFVEAMAPNSNVLTTRALRASEQLDGKSVVDQVLGSLLEAADNAAAKTAWLAEYRGARRVGVSHEAATQLADESTAKLMGMYDKMFVPQLLRSKTAKLAIPFQTFAFNQFNQLSRDAFILGKEKGSVEGMKYFARMVGIMMATNAIYRSALGQEPFPVTEDGDIQPIGLLPVVGSFARYGTPGTVKGMAAPFAVGYGLLARDADVMRWGKKNLEQTARYLGVPGTAQLLKTLNGISVVDKGGIQSGNVFIPVEGSVDTMRTLLNGKWGASSADEYLKEMDEKNNTRFYKELDKSIPGR